MVREVRSFSTETIHATVKTDRPMYSADVRRIALRLYEQLSSFRKVAALLGTSHSTISRWRHETQTRAPGSSGPPPRLKKLQTPPVLNAITLFLAGHPFATVADVQSALAAQLGLTASSELVRLAIRKAGFTRKRARWFSVPRHDPAVLQQFLAARAAFVAQRRLFVSIDETSFGRNTRPAIGYAPRGKRLRLQRESASIRTSSVVAATALGEPVRLQARFGSFATDSFTSFLESLPFPPRTVLLMDNVSFHHSRRVAELCRTRAWDMLFVPPYSPVFNPIEGVFSIVNRHYHRHQNIGAAFAAVTSAQMAGFFRGSFQAVQR